MLKKFASSLLVVMLLMGCGTKPSASNVVPGGTETAVSNDSAEQEAEKLVDELKLTDEMTLAKERVMLGMVFGGDADAVKSGALYLSSETGNSNTVGVFQTDDVKKCEDYINAYLETQKASTETYYPEEVFKISNAIIQDNGKDCVVLVICEDIENAKKMVSDYLS